MANKIFDDYQGPSIKINGVCYKFIGETTEPFDSNPSEIEGEFDSCLACALESSSSNSSESIGNFSTSSSSSSSEVPVVLGNGETVDVDEVLGAGHYGRVQITYTGDPTPPNAAGVVTVNNVSYNIANEDPDFAWDYDDAQNGRHVFTVIGETIHRTADGKEFSVTWDGTGSIIFTVDVEDINKSSSSSSSSSFDDFKAWNDFATDGPKPKTWADMSNSGDYPRTWSELQS